MRSMSQYINGQLQDSVTGTTADVIDPSSGEGVATITLARPKDVDHAVRAATNAYPVWSRATPGERVAVLAGFARLLATRADEITRLESRQPASRSGLTASSST
jgi:betaine-aldehyde dehydrogenase